MSASTLHGVGIYTPSEHHTAMLLAHLAAFTPVLWFFYAAVLQNTPVTVSLKTGTSFRGVRVAVNNTEQFLGIPFAQPPVGNLRFKAPVAINNPVRGVRDASQFGNACPQPASTSGSAIDAGLGAAVGEDCLVLNVYRPAGTEATAKLPVLVWFYVSESDRCLELLESHA